MAGLRREEVAVLAGVDDADYYTRLEQGRERHPSAQVLDALSRALLLDVDAPDHLRDPGAGACCRRAVGGADTARRVVQKPVIGAVPTSWRAPS